MFATTYVDGLPIYPVFSLYFLSNLPKGFIAIFTMVIDNDITGAINLTDLPIGYIAQTVIHAFHNHRHMLTGRSCECEYRVVFVLATGYMNHMS